MFIYEHKTPGFTISELIIVIAIIGILAAIAVPTYFGYTKKSEGGEVVQDANSPVTSQPNTASSPASAS